MPAYDSEQIYFLVPDLSKLFGIPRKRVFQLFREHSIEVVRLKHIMYVLKPRTKDGVNKEISRTAVRVHDAKKLAVLYGKEELIDRAVAGVIAYRDETKDYGLGSLPLESALDRPSTDSA